MSIDIHHHNLGCSNEAAIILSFSLLLSVFLSLSIYICKICQTNINMNTYKSGGSNEAAVNLSLALSLALSLVLSGLLSLYILHIIYIKMLMYTQHTNQITTYKSDIYITYNIYYI